MLIDPNVFSLVLVRSSWEFSDDGGSLIRLILIRARIIIILSNVRSSKVSRIIAVKTTSFNFTITVLKSSFKFILSYLRLRARNCLLVNPNIFTFVLISSSRLFSNDSNSLIRLVLIRTWVVIIFSFIRCCEVS